MGDSIGKYARFLEIKIENATEALNEETNSLCPDVQYIKKLKNKIRKYENKLAGIVI